MSVDRLTDQPAPIAWMTHDSAYMRNRIAWNQQDIDEAGAGLDWVPLYAEPIAPSERFTLCADCGCELECVKHGCAKKYDAAKELAGAYWRLEKYGYIATHNADDDDNEAEAEHWRNIATSAVERIRSLYAAPQVPSVPYSSPTAGEHPDKPAESASRCVAAPQTDPQTHSLLHSVREKWGAMRGRYERVGSDWHLKMPGDWPIEVVMSMYELRHLAALRLDGERPDKDKERNA